MPKSTGKLWMGTTEACSYLGIGLRTLYKLIDDGEIRAYKIGRVIRLQKAEVDLFLREHVIEPGTLGHLLPPFEPTGAAGRHEEWPAPDVSQADHRPGRRKHRATQKRTP